MMIVGLTGGIGSGKTTVSNMFKALGVPVYNSDIEAKALMNTSDSLRASIIVLLGSKAYENNKLNRKYVAEQVFSDSDLLDKLNKIVHPAVRADFKEWANKQSAAYVIQEAAVIFENNSQEFYDMVVLITAPIEERVKRVIRRDRATLKAIMERMQNQWKDEKKMSLANYVIENVNIQNTEQLVADFHEKMLKLTKS